MRQNRVVYTEDFIKNMFKDGDFELIDILEFNGIKSKIKIKCLKCNKIFDRKLENFKKTLCCPFCWKNPKKITFNQAKSCVEVESNSGCKFLETKESYNQKRKEIPKLALCEFDFQCACGNLFSTTLNRFNSKKAPKRQCNECGHKMLGDALRHTYEEVKHYIEIESNSGCKLLSSEYIDNHKKLHIQCSCGNDFYRALAEFKGRKLFKCPLCTGAMVKFTYEQVQQDLEQHGIELLSNIYQNNMTKLKIKYSCGHIAKRDLCGIKESDYKCPYCIKSGYLRNTETFKKEVKDLVGYEYEVLSEYTKMHDTIYMKHNKCGHKYYVIARNFLKLGARCPYCQSSKGEIFITDWLNKNNIYYQEQYSFADLKGYHNCLRFDFAIFDNISKNSLKMLIEYDGEFHYFPLQGEDKLKQQQHYDNLKDEYCKKNNIELLRIPYWDFNNLESILHENIIKGSVTSV